MPNQDAGVTDACMQATYEGETDLDFASVVLLRRSRRGGFSMRLRSDAGAVAVRRGPLPGGGALSYAIAIGWSARIYPRQHPPEGNNEGGRVKGE